MKGKQREEELATARGTFRVTSDDFSEALNDRESWQYESMEKKYSKMITATYRKSDLQGDNSIETFFS